MSTVAVQNETQQTRLKKKSTTSERLEYSKRNEPTKRYDNTRKQSDIRTPKVSRISLESSRKVTPIELKPSLNPAHNSTEGSLSVVIPQPTTATHSGYVGTSLVVREQYWYCAKWSKRERVLLMLVGALASVVFVLITVTLITRQNDRTPSGRW